MGALFIVDRPPDHDASVLLVAHNLGNIVTGSCDGSLVIWTLRNNGKFVPELLCCGHRGSIKNLCLANSLDEREKNYFVSHSSNNELALWNWGNGTCVKFKLDSRYHHIRIESYQPSFLDARLLLCCGRYPCIVVMHAMQLAPLYTLSSTSQPDWIADLSVFTHSNLHQEVVLGLSASGVVTVWTLTGEELLGETTHEHESRIISAPSKILEIHCCRQFPRLVLVICATEWRVLDAIDCSTLARSPAPPDDSFTGGAFFHKEYVAVYTDRGEVHIFRLSLEVTSKNADRQVEKPRRLATLLLSENTGSGCCRNSQPHPPTFAHFELLKCCRANLTSLGVRNAVTLFFACHHDGSLHAWCLTTDLLVSEDSSAPSLEPFLRNSLADSWRSYRESPTTNSFTVPAEPGSSLAIPTTDATKTVVTCCIIVYSTSENGPSHINHGRRSVTSCPLVPRLILGLESGEILVAPLSDFLSSLLSPRSSASPPSPFVQLSGTTGAHVNGGVPSTGPRHFNHYCLSGHKGAVLCLLHPYGFNSQTHRATASDAAAPTSRGAASSSLVTPFRPNILCSGGMDCSVRIWDLDPHATHSDPTLACLGVFYCHAAPVVGLATCICSVAHDGSVALLSPQDKQLVLRARTGPGGAVGARVHSIGWRLPEVLLLLLDEDGNLTVWDAASGRLERFETGAQAEDLFQTASDVQLVTPSLSTWTPALASHLYSRGGGGGGGGCLRVVPINESAAAGAASLTLPSSLLINRGDALNPEAFAAPVLIQTVGSCAVTRASDSSADLGEGDAVKNWIVCGPAAFVFHFDVEALIRNLLAMASPESPDALNKPSDYAFVPLGLYSCWELTRLLLSFICPLEDMSKDDPELLSFLRSCLAPGDDPLLSPHDLRFRFACASEGGCLTLRLPTPTAPSSSSAAPPVCSLSSSIVTSLCLSIMSLAECLCSLPPTRAAELVGPAADGREPVAFLRPLALLLAQRVTADLTVYLREPAAPSLDGCRINLCVLVSFWQAKCLQIRFAARTLIYTYLDLLPLPLWREFLSQWSGCLPTVKSNHHSYQEGSNPLSFTVNGGGGGGYASPPDGSYEEGMSAIQYPGGDLSPRVDYHIPNSPPSLPLNKSSSLPKAVATCPPLDRLLMALTLDSAFYDNFPPPPLLPTSDPTLRNPLARRLKIGAILMLGVVGSRISAETLLTPGVAARDLAPDDWSATQAFQGLAAPFYGPSKPTGGGGGGEAVLTDRSQKAKLFEDLELPRRIACLLEAIFSYIAPPTRNDCDPPPLKSSPAQSSPVRRTAIDLLTRGFTAWEPYLDAAQFVNSLLTISADADSTLGIFKLGCVLTEVADLARSARQGIWSLTYTRPHLIVWTLSLTLRRLGPNLGSFMSVGSQTADKSPPPPPPPSQPSTTPSTPTLRVVMSSPTLAAPIFTLSANDSSSLHTSTAAQGGAASTALNMQPLLPLLRARSELVHLFEDLCQRRPTDLLPILPELVEVLLVCVDRIRLKERGLDVTFPALQRFRNVDSHTRAQKICVGGTNGSLTFFDFKTGRYFSTQAHEASVTAVKFSSDGRQMASYSLNENKLRVWQLSTSGLFGMGGQQVKALIVHPVRPLAPPGGSAPKTHGKYQTDAQGCIEAQLPTIALDWTEAACINILQNGLNIRQVKL
ncbi:WD repeat-containing protein 7 [Sparganum proliferum]